MGSFICRQPNGLLCRFSTVVDTVTHYNMTDEEYIQMKMEQAREEAEDTIKNYIKPFEWIDDYFVDNNMTEEEFEQIKAKMYKPKEETIKALEQEPILDKIRTEIEDTGAYEQEVNGRTEFAKGITYCLNIIDKYMEGRD